jgi:hypothetical protein
MVGMITIKTIKTMGIVVIMVISEVNSIQIILNIMNMGLVIMKIIVMTSDEIHKKINSYEHVLCTDP